MVEFFLEIESNRAESETRVQVLNKGNRNGGGEHFKMDWEVSSEGIDGTSTMVNV